MKKRLWWAGALAGVLAVTVLASLALSQSAEQKTAAAKTADTKAGCAMHDAATAAAKTADAKAGCAMHDAATAAAKTADAKVGCAMHDAATAAAKPGDPKPGCPMMGAATADMKGCAMHGADAKGCGMGAAAAGMPGCGMQGAGMEGCGMGAAAGMPGPGMGRRMRGPGMRGGPMGAGACGPGMGLGCGPEMMRALDLKDDQRKRIVGICDRFQRLAIQKQADLRVAALDMRQLAHSETPDKAKLDAQVDKIARMRADLAKARIGAMLEVRSVLTPEQLKKWQARPMGMGGLDGGDDGIEG